MSVSVQRWFCILCFAGLTSPRSTACQHPADVSRVLGLMSLDSVKSGSIVTYFHRADSVRAAGLHTLMRRFVAFMRDHAATEVPVRIAVLGPAQWSQLSGMPYGYPFHIGPPSNLLLMASAPAPPAGLDTLLRGRTRDLLSMAHEGAHLLGYSFLPAGMRDSTSMPNRFLSPELVRRFVRLDENPAWSAEFAATYFATIFIKASYPEDASAWRSFYEALAAQPGQRFVHLDDWFEVMKRDQQGKSYFDSKEGKQNFGWYQGVAGLIAHHVAYSERPERVVAVLRRINADEAHWPVKTPALVAELESLFPGLTALLRRIGAPYER